MTIQPNLYNDIEVQLLAVAMSVVWLSFYSTMQRICVRLAHFRP